MTDLAIPANVPDDLAGAALAYADAGWYVGPLKPGTKNPGSILGNDWPAKTSRDPQVIVGWFAATDAGGLFLHVGRSGAVAVDVDNLDVLPAELATALLFDGTVPCQKTRPNRAHFLLRMPSGRTIGNSSVGFPGCDIRGNGGVIVVAPTEHPEKAEGACYAWLRTGPLPECPPVVSGRLVDAYEADSAVTDAEVQRWVTEHRTGTDPDRLRPILNLYRNRAENGSRHGAVVACLTWAAKEVNAGFIAAPEMVAELLALHEEHLARTDHPNGARRNTDFAGALAWAIPQAYLTPLEDHMYDGVGRQKSTPVAAPAPPADTEHDRESWDSVELLEHSFPDIDWGIPDLIPPGLAMLSGPPKQGKSFLMLAASLAVATGSWFLGQHARPGAVLYCALEDGARRARTRLLLMPDREKLRPGALQIRTVAPRVDDGLLDVLDAWIGATEKAGLVPRMVVLDVFQRVRALSTTNGKHSYADDYAALAPLQRWANQRGICLVVLHHNRKSIGDDPFDSVSGTTGLTGGVDMVMVLRGPRGEDEATLYVTGRDAQEDHEYSLIRIKGLWELGDMPVSLVNAPKSALVRKVWRDINAAGTAGLTTEQVAQQRGTDAVAAASKSLNRMSEHGWVRPLNTSAPNTPVRWGAIKQLL